MPHRPEDNEGVGHGGHDVSRPGEESNPAIEGTHEGPRVTGDTQTPRPRGSSAGRIPAHGGGGKERSGPSRR
jgi:hypothetical protein